MRGSSSAEIDLGERGGRKWGRVAFASRLERESRVVSAPPDSPRSQSCPRALLALLVGGLPACGARTHVETPGPIASTAPAGGADAGGGAATAARDGGVGAGNLENGSALAQVLSLDGGKQHRLGRR